MTLRILQIALLMSLIGATRAPAAEVLLGIITETSVTTSNEEAAVQSSTALQRLNERHFQEIAARQVQEMASLGQLALVGLNIAPTLSTLSSAPVDSQEVVSYNQWLGSSFVSSPTATPMQVTGLNLRLNAVARNENTFIAITESVNQRPDIDRVIARLDTSELSTIALHTPLQVDLLPDCLLYTSPSPRD